MPIRIYALAKQLKLDSKSLVEICKEAGVEGKGSALASLTDDEVDRVNAHLASRSRPSKSAPPAAASLTPQKPKEGTTVRREDYLGPGGTVASGKIPVLKRPASPEKKSFEAGTRGRAGGRRDASGGRDTGDGRDTSGGRSIGNERSSGNGRKLGSGSRDAGPKRLLKLPRLPPQPKRKRRRVERRWWRRRCLCGRMIEERKIPVLGGPRKKNGNGGEKDSSEKEKPQGPTIKLAPMPVVKQKAKPKKEQATQKPDIRLPLDAIRAGRKRGKATACQTS